MGTVENVAILIRTVSLFASTCAPVSPNSRMSSTIAEIIGPKASEKTSFFRSLFIISSAIKSALAFHSTVQIKVPLVTALTLSGQDGRDLLHVLAVGHAGLALDPVLEDRLHDGAHGEEGGRLGVDGIGINAFLSVYIHRVGYKKGIARNLFLTRPFNNDD